MKNKLLVILSVLLLTSFFACGKGSEDHHDAENHADHAEMDHHGDQDQDGHSMKTQYQSAQAGSLKASFEFSTMADHMESMKKMGIEMKMDHSKMGDHHVNLTLLNNSDGKMNMDVKELSFIIAGPDGKSVTKKAHIMHAENMHHFGIDLNASGAGTYKVKAQFKHEGKILTPEVSFSM